MIRPALRLVQSRRSFAQWQRQRLLDVFAELEALRADRARLLRLTRQKRGRCAQCRVRTILTICADGWSRCPGCLAAPKEHTA